MRAHGRGVPPPPGGRRGQHAVAAQRVEQLHRLVRIAGRVRLDQLGQGRRRGRIHVQHLGDHGDQTRHGQVVQPQVPHPGLLAPSRQQRRQRVRRVHVVVAVGAHQQQALDRLLAQHQVDEAERGAPGPLQVVDEHHHRPFPRRDRPQHLHAAALRPHLRGQRIPRHPAAPPAAPRTPAPPRSADPRSARPPPGSARGPRPARPPARPAAADPARETPDATASNSRSRRYWSNLPATNQPSLAGHHRPQLIDQRRLAHPRRPADQHPTTPAGQRVLERRLQRRHLVVATHQPRRRQQPQRNIVLADPQRDRRRARSASRSRSRS